MATTRTARTVATLARVALLAAVAAAVAVWWAAAPAHADVDVVDVDELADTVETFGDVEDARTDGDDTFYLLGVDAAAFTSPWSGDLVFVNEHGRGDRGPYRYGFLQVHLGGGDRGDDVLAVRGPRDSGSWDADTPVEVRATDVSEALDTDSAYCDDGEDPGVEWEPPAAGGPPPVVDGPLQGDCIPPPGSTYSDLGAGGHAPLYSSDGRWYDSSTGRPAYFGPCGEPGTRTRTSDAQVRGQMRQPDGTLTDVYYTPDGNPNECEQPPATDEDGTPLGEPTFVVSPGEGASYCANDYWEPTGFDDLPGEEPTKPGPPPERDDVYERGGEECVPPPGIHYELGEPGVHWPVAVSPDGDEWWDTKTARTAYYGICGEPGREWDGDPADLDGIDDLTNVAGEVELAGSYTDSLHPIEQPDGSVIVAEYQWSGYEPADDGCDPPAEIGDFCDHFPDHPECNGGRPDADDEDSDGERPTSDDKDRPDDGEAPYSTTRRPVDGAPEVWTEERDEQPFPDVVAFEMELEVPDAAHVGGHRSPARVRSSHDGTDSVVCESDCRDGDYELEGVQADLRLDGPDGFVHDEGRRGDWTQVDYEMRNGFGELIAHFHNAPDGDDEMVAGVDGTADVRVREHWTEDYYYRYERWRHDSCAVELPPEDPDDPDAEPTCHPGWVPTGDIRTDTFGPETQDRYYDQWVTVPVRVDDERFPVLSATTR